MHLKALIALAAACLVGQTVAADRHQHGHRNLHTKRDVFTEVVTVTNWVTVTVTGGGSSTRARTHYTNSRKYRTRSSSESTTTSSVPAPPPSTPLAVPTTIVTQVKPATPSDDPSVAPPADTAPPVVQPPPPPVDTQPPPPPVGTQPPPPPPPPASSSTPAQDPARDGNGGNGGTGGVKRGLAYNKRELLSRFLNAGSKVSWLYNWGQYDDSNTDLEFCPMLWGLKLDFAQTWPGNAQKAIDAGSRCLFSFNEPDLDSQANMSPQLAAEKHIELMNPFSGQARIGTPAITNSVSPNQGIDWMRQWFNACGGRCAADFVNIHIYGVDTKTFLAHVLNVYNTFRMPVWITEFAFNGAEDEINSQLATVIEQIEHNSTFAFVERYSYFMVEEGFMVKGNSMSSYGNTFAYGA